MQIIKAYKTELDPNNKQRGMMARCCGASRYVYNWGLAEWKRQYEKGEKPSEYGLRRKFNAEKDSMCPWIRLLPYAITEGAFANLGKAFQNFFRRIKNGQSEPGYPKFKKRGAVNSFHLRNTKVKNDRVRLTGMSWVRLKEHGYIPVDAEKYGVYATISERAGRWFISISVKEEMPDPINDSAIALGVDFGLKSLAVCSDGTVYENPRPLHQAQHKLKRLQRELSRRNRDGTNWRKTKAKIAKQHARIANIRAHTLHNISHDLVINKRPSIIVLENLNVSGMMKNHSLAQAIADVGFYELRRQIEYKAQRCGVNVLLADTWFPSSKLCRFCGCINKDLKMSDRKWQCDCGAILDRDLNAALNLAALANRETRGDCLGS